jgi:Leucine-rich repeat (LRR) protein
MKLMFVIIFISITLLSNNQYDSPIFIYCGTPNGWIEMNARSVSNYLNSKTGFLQNKKTVLKIYNDCDCDSLRYFAKRTKIESLKIINYNVNHVICNIENFSNLKELDLSNNGLERLPIGILKIKHLESLDLCNNPALSSDTTFLTLSKLNSLKSLRFCENEILNIPANLSLGKNIEFIDFSDNKLDTLPDWIFKLPRLKILLLSSNMFLNRIESYNINIDYTNNPKE